MVCYATLSELLILTRDVIDLELDVSRLKELFPAFFDRALYL